jgi:RNA polymerase subunit RPABC4/transcription elongation factor Spt4
MEQLFNLLGVGLTWGVAILGGLLAAFWIGLIIWTWRDIRLRSSDIFAAILASLLVAIFNVVGLLIYILVRPKQTLAEQYDRALEEEILLRELEQAPDCWNCGRPVQADWRYCPYCEVELKRPCAHCGYLLEPEWKRCPQCGAPAEDFTQGQGAQARAESSAPAEVVPPPAQPEPEPDPAMFAPPTSDVTAAREPGDGETDAAAEAEPTPATVSLPEAEAIAQAEKIKEAQAAAEGTD